MQRGRDQVEGSPRPEDHGVAEISSQVKEHKQRGNDGEGQKDY